jgi:predicted KAP-like P-loop ATPase
MSIGRKNEILENLRLYADKPDKESDLFQFKVFADKLADLLMDENLPTPYSIMLHGEWGSGKTSLLERVFDLVKKRSDKKEWKLVWFSAWTYENLDPMLALMQTIEVQYENRSSKIKDVINGFLLMSADIVLRSRTGLTLEQVQERFKKIVNDIPSVTDELEKMIGETSRLVVFIDDLDRCSVDNVLKVLEAVP